MQGYKSFAARTELTFPGAITAIVGPNGSGKSNVADALRWVLGEQSFSQLRSRRTTDLIFAGTDGRARVGMAEVTIVLDNSDGSLPLDFQEVSISRRAYRSGDNEYYLNGSRVRLKDVSELLAQGGIDRLTFSVVGQGMVDAALSLSSSERRRLFEEAAGITSHQSKREVALRQLEETAGNVLRAHDLMRELEPQLQRLSAQAEQARRWHDVQAGLADVQVRYYRRRLAEAAAKARASRERSDYLQQRLALQADELSDLHATIDRLVQEEQRQAAELDARQAEADRLRASLAAADREQAVLGERERSLRERLDESERDRQDLTEEVAAAAAERETLERDWKRLQEESATLQTEVAALEAAQQAERRRRRDTEERLQQVRRQLSAAMAHGTEAEAQRESALRRADELDRLLGEGRTTLDAEGAAAQSGQAEVERLSAAAGQEAATLAEAQRSLEERRADLTAARQALAGAQRRARAAEEEEQALRARLSLLARMQRESYYPGVREVLARAEQEGDRSGIIGTVGSLVQVPEELEIAIEAALGGRLQQVVVKQWRDAEAAIEHLKRRRAGRVTFLPLETIRPPSPLEPARFDGLIGVASDLVQVEPGLEAVSQYLLNRVLIVRDLAAARVALARVKGSFTVATLSGETAQSSGSVTGGGERSGRGALLERERERRALPDDIRRKRAEREAVAEEGERLRAAIEAAEREATEADRGLQQVRSAVEQAEAEENRARMEQRRAQERLRWQRERLAELEKERATLAGRATGAQERLAATEAEVARLHEAARTIEDELAQMGDDGERGLQAQRLRLTDLRERLGRAAAAAQSAEQRHRRLVARSEERAQQATALQDELAEVARRRQEALSAGGGRSESLAALETALAPARTRLAAGRQLRQSVEAEDRVRRQRHLEFSAVCSEAEVIAGRNRDALQALRDSAELELDEDVFRSLVEADDAAPVEDEQPLAELESQVESLRRRRRALGGVNPNAPEEYEELHARFDFLSTQATDLEQAAASLREVIAELEQTMQRRFRTTFDRVSVRFEALFQELFSGGAAHLSLSDDKDLSTTGVEITVRPPGKRSQDLALLSGGERALTSVALLFALLEASGTPFCVMDEVDAMLDEANVGRFRRVLESLATRTQFILISHNRRTIEAADAIYGVTMAEDGTSRLLSLMLNEAEKIASSS